MLKDNGNRKSFVLIPLKMNRFVTKVCELRLSITMRKKLTVENVKKNK